MNARVFILAALLPGCEAVASVDLHYVGDGAASDALVADAGPVEHANDDADPGSGPSGLCGCDFTAGESCCIPAGGDPAFCATSGQACAAGGGVGIGCTSSNADAVCCWHGDAKPGSFTRYTTSCDNGPAACATSADCNGGTCEIQKCGTVSISACNVTPACP
jgi:hypothetical protein